MSFKIFIVLSFCSSVLFISAQEITGNQLLEKTIAHHDPHGTWSIFKGNLQITMQTPDKGDRVSNIVIDFPKEYFKLSATRDSVTTTYILDRKDCDLALNGNSEIPEVDKKKYNLNCERGRLMKDYYTYLYGLPMKLKDPGTILDQKVIRKTFKGKEYLVLKASYTEAVGKDVWYFYFDPKTYAMEVYQFFHDEAKNDGEYILLNDTKTVQGIQMPKIRKWYYNSDNTYLGMDILD